MIMKEVIVQLCKTPEGVELQRRVSYLIWREIFGVWLGLGLGGFSKNVQFNHPLRFIYIYNTLS